MPIGRATDILSSCKRFLLLYGLPTLAIMASRYLGSAGVATLVWPVAFLVMGVACVANARRCGRVHCYFTGPLFLIASAVSALHGLGALDLGPEGRRNIGSAAFLAALVLCFAPELIWGPYFKRTGDVR